MPETSSHALVTAASRLSAAANDLHFSSPVTHVYNPLDYAWNIHREYLQRYGSCRGGVLFLGINPGPFGMAQTGIPFGEIAAVRDWLGLQGEVDRPTREHPKRPIEGFACSRSEVSGRRLWGLFADRFTSPEAFFANHFVANYCPLLFAGESGKNLTPDKLPASERAPLLDACDHHLQELLRILEPAWIIGVGSFAEERAREAVAARGEAGTRVGRILHPSPASPAANRGWAKQAEQQLVKVGVWKDRNG
jgi:single-strand selective monofunctional uracil DNA glycosylase